MAQPKAAARVARGAGSTHNGDMFKRALLPVLTLVALVLSGCSLISNNTYSMNDQMFAAMMIPHHEQAIEMSDLALTASSNPEVLALATQIKAAQAPEIEEMKTWGQTSMMDHSGHGMTMGGMLSDSEIATLKSATGVEFDRLFLAGMIAHHEGAIEMAQDILESKNPKVRDFASKIIEVQAAEIATMKALLEKIGN